MTERTPASSIALMAFNVAVWAASFGFAAYVVFWLHRSPWWFVAAVFVAIAGQHRWKTKGEDK